MNRLRWPVALGLSLAGARLVAACSSTIDSGSAVDPTSPEGPTASEDAASGQTNDAARDARTEADSSLGGSDAGALCVSRCEKAGCTDLEACAERCRRMYAVIPAACDALVSALNACAEANDDKWKCVKGEAKLSGECLNESVAVVQCAVAIAMDGGLDGGADAGF